MTWYYALCQHPMYMIIEHDDTAAERTPPWGEPDVQSYIDRIRRNVDALERYPFLKFNYDFSGVELEDLAERSPDLMQRFRQYIEEGRVGFVDGSYAQAHLQGLGAESNLRQMREGLDAIERAVGIRVKTYAHQEAAVHDQMPQILRALGYQYAVTPGFFWAMTFLTPHEIQGVQYQGLRFLQDEEVAHWLGLDNTAIPLYLTHPRLRPKGGIHGSDSHQHALRSEWVKGLLHYPPIRCDFPDMVDIDEEWLADHAGQEYVILDEALDQRLKETPVRSQVRLYTYWGYGEGIEAEYLHRVDREAERALLEAEGLNALALALTGRAADDFGVAWRKLLRAQHHDAYWVAGVGLRRKAITWALEAKRAAEESIAAATQCIVAGVDTPVAADGQAVVIWEPWPVSRTEVAIVDLVTPQATQADVAYQVIDGNGETLPSQVIDYKPQPDGSHLARVLMLATTHGLGYDVVNVRRSTDPQVHLRASSLIHENDFYHIAIEPDATVASLRTPTGRELIDSKRGSGNLLRAFSPEGERVQFFPTAEPEFQSGPAAHIINIPGVLGNAQLKQTIWMYRHIPRIDFTLTFDFDDTSLGNYWQDESKLNCYWPVDPVGEIHHDIPFGVISGREERTFFPTQWVRVGSPEAGLATFHRGTNRFWIRDNVLANVLACGMYGRDIGTRAQPEMYIKDYDLRLKGHHVLHYAIYPHDGSWQEANVPGQAFSYTYPLRTTKVREQPDSLPRDLVLARLETQALLPTAIFADEDGITCRFFETMGSTVAPQIACTTPWSVSRVQTLAGDEIEKIPPYTIIEMRLRSD